VGAAIVAGITPGVGEALDGYVLVDPNSTWLERTGAGISLAANFFFPVLPNFGAVIRAGGTATRNVRGGLATADEALDGALRWLGDDYKEIAPGVFRSGDGSRQFRMTGSDLTDPSLGPHIHFESIGRDGRTIMENSHVLLRRK
jgi:hypothetical protein